MMFSILRRLIIPIITIPLLTIASNTVSGQSCQVLYEKTLEAMYRNQPKEANIYAEAGCKACSLSSPKEYAKMLRLSLYLSEKFNIPGKPAKAQAFLELLQNTPDLENTFGLGMAFDLNEARKKAAGLYNTSGHKDIFHSLSKLYDLVGNGPLASFAITRFDWVNDSLSRAKLTTDPTTLILFYTMYANMCRVSGYLNKALAIYRKAQSLHYQSNDTLLVEVIRLTGNISINELLDDQINTGMTDCYISLDSFPPALSMIHSRMSTAEKLDDGSMPKMILKYNQALVYLRQNQYETAYPILKEIFIPELQKIAGDNPLFFLNLLNSFIKASLETNKLENMSAMINVGLQASSTYALLDSTAALVNRMDLLITAGQYYLKVNKTDSAQVYLTEAAEIAISSWNVALIKLEYYTRAFAKKLIALKDCLYSAQKKNSDENSKRLSYRLEKIIEEIYLTDKILPKIHFASNIDSTLQSLQKRTYANLGINPNDISLSDQLKELMDARGQIHQPGRLIEEKNITYDSIRNYLRPGEAFVRFIKFENYDDGYWAGQEYGCYIFLKSQVPKLLFLFSGNQLSNAMNNYSYLYGTENGDSTGTNGKQWSIIIALLVSAALATLLTFSAAWLFKWHLRGSLICGALLFAGLCFLSLKYWSVSLSKTDTIFEERMRTNFYTVVWGKIDQYLADKGIEKITVLPDGMLNRVSFADLFAANKKLANTRLTLSMSFGKLPADTVPVFATAAVFGGINYGGDKPSFDSKKQLLKDSLPKTRSGIVPQFWEPLLNTATEKKGICALFQTNGIDTSPDSAFTSEAQFKRLSGQSLSIIHLATHGFYYPYQPLTNNAAAPGTMSGNIPFIADPMFRSGMVLAGANLKWADRKNADPDEDGILTAYEIAGLDFTKTDLVVLSACETGLGDIKDGEGIYGLVRAFKLSGVNNIIVTLRPILDQFAQAFMVSFYDNLVAKKMSIADAFNETQKAFQQTYPTNPEYWSAFQLYQ